MANEPQNTQVKPANDAYTGMLAVSLIALLLGSAVLYLDYSQYPSTAPPRVDFTPKDRSPPDMEAKAPAPAAAPDDNPPPAAPDNANNNPDKKGG